MPFADYPDLEDLEITTGIYLATDTEQRVRWLEQTNHEGDLVAQLDKHARSPPRRPRCSRLCGSYTWPTSPRPK